ncbi:type VII secretion protein EccC [Mycobacterium sp. 852002-51163_SCH5372311]|uniref:type VII secretion protein EccCa n=1 Tax=Mycobacterium sp. 852002-51163_SCH5372311 TaxID=1834097 RepID=UPI0007FE3799|nr:type VII secretion protein EccCa [Mycobacterium sp. 852002-51163_SCH5372311]OBF80494.1 type VII secretion protein EccC [Mycobacterium sp. 852002-51163_SCH5372311]
MTTSFAPATRRPPPTIDGADIAVAAPPEVAHPTASGLLMRLLPALTSVATLGVMAAAFFSGSGVSRNPTFLALPMVLLMSVVVTALTGRGRGQGARIAADRVAYLGYLSGLRRTVTEIAAAQRCSLRRDHPDPDTLWTLIGGPRMWERSDFYVARVGLGGRPLASRLVAPEPRPGQRSDPVTTAALRRFLRAHSMVADLPVAIALRAGETVVIDGDSVGARALMRAMVCQLAVLHPPDQMLIAGAIGAPRRAEWEWLKWLPHNQHPNTADTLGSARLVYSTLAEVQATLTEVAAPPLVVVVCDSDEPAVGCSIPGACVITVGSTGDAVPLVVRHRGEAEELTRPDQMTLLDALICAHRLAAYRVGEPSGRVLDTGWLDLVGIGDVGSFDPIILWRGQNRRDRLCVAIGTTTDGMPLELDIKEPAENGMGPHGLCVGATGSGKSELLRTVALGMMARNSPTVLNLLLIDFKGGATFLDLARAPHVAAVITNLAEEAHLVARMRDALAGEMNRRQHVLRAAGNFVSVAAYEEARRAGARLTPLPTLFIVVDEFSELLSQHPDFADMFVAIGRLGRSLGMHLLLASQRLDEGRLRGLEAHLSYRLCLKTLSASDSRTVLGTLDAYQLPNTPGAGLLRSATGELVRFQTAYVSTPIEPEKMPMRTEPPAVQLFTAAPSGAVTATGAMRSSGGPARTVLQAVLDRLSGHGPPAHQVWLPPLEATRELSAVLSSAGSKLHVLRVPIGVVDNPFEQCRTPLMVDLSGAAGNVAVVGAPQTGKSTALRTLIKALAATHDAGQVQFYCLDFGGGTLASLRALPQVGDVAGRAEPRLVGRMVAELHSVLRSREERLRSHGISGWGHVFLVVDGWAGLCREFDRLEESIAALAVQGLSFGMHVVVSASRWAEIRPSLKDQIGTRIELRLGDPADSDVDRKRAQQVPHDRPGRGLSRDGLHMLIASPGEDVGVRREGGLVAPPIPLLPARVDYAGLVASSESGAAILLGIEECRLRPVAVDFERSPHLLILGDNDCGKTAALRLLCREIVRTRTAAQARLLIVDYRRTLLGAVDSEHVDAHAMSPAALRAWFPDLVESLRERMPPPDLSHAQLLARAWWSGPDIYLVVDDYDLVATAGNPLLELLEYLPHATDLGLHLIVARRSGGAARAMFEPLLAALRELGCTGLRMSGNPDEGALLGSGRPEVLPPGRGVLIAGAGDERMVQIAWSPPR